MAVTLKNLSGAQYGVEAAETGVEVMSFEVRYYPEFKELFPSRLNQTTGFAVPDKLSVEVTIEANKLGTTGLMVATHVTAITPGNDINAYQATPGGLYMDEVTESQVHDGWRKISMKLTSHPECA
jgi:hypothetical protein